MPDKQNESKFMAMLERRGIVRKTGSEGGSLEKDPDSAGTRPEADLRSMFDSQAGDTMKVMPAARQPVPGMLNPVIPGERPQRSQLEQPQPLPRSDPDQPWPLAGFQPAPAKPGAQAEPEQPKPDERAQAEPPKRVEIPKPTPFFSGADFGEDITADKRYTATPGMPVAPVPTAQPGGQYAPGVPYSPAAPPAAGMYDKPPEPPPIESYADRYLDIDELYKALSINSKRTDTIYLIEEYLKTLPESLPDESRREIINKIVAASGFDFDLLMGDGVLRVKILKEYAEKFARHTDEYVSARNTELDELDQQIMRIRRLIENRRDLHKKQFFAIEAEAQRLKDILTFISG